MFRSQDEILLKFSPCIRMGNKGYLSYSECGMVVGARLTVSLMQNQLYGSQRMVQKCEMAENALLTSGAWADWFKMIEKQQWPGQMNLDFYCQMIWSELHVNNMKAWIHSAL
ncbi:hypothetical protein AMECASPLE_030785 [Ameca splendens]|uniref:Uncharacterized protein n=1 Tax=Ameca splendens TaxID=208324 RepID=A0ABV1A353_9TELE